MSTTSPADTKKKLHLERGRLEERFEEKKPLYDASEAVAEANRCLYCVDAPCIKACPTAIDIPTFIHKIAAGNVKGAARTILEQNLLGDSCGQVCPVEVLCAGACVYNEWEREPIKIGRLQHYAVRKALEEKPILFEAAKDDTGKKVALVGAGPASIAAAGWLALRGHRAVIFERKVIPGGLNTLGIAPYKMKGDDALREIDWVLSLGKGRIEIKTGVSVVAEVTGEGQVSAGDLLRDFDAVFLGLGLGADSRLDIPNEDGEGVVGATAFIERLKADPGLKLEKVKHAIVIGGGNTALDVAHELPLLGVDTQMVYRRNRGSMSGYAHELDGARVDGAKLVEDRIPVSVVRTNGKLVALEVAPAKDGKRIDGAPTEEIPADLIVVAIGQNRATEVARAFPGVQLDDKGRVQVEGSSGRTSNPKVYSGGDCVNGGKEVVNAVAEARVAVEAMHVAMMGVH